MKVRFEGSSTGGFDELSAPNWQIIEKGELAVVWLYDAPDAEVEILAPGIAQLEEIPIGTQFDRGGNVIPQSPVKRNFRIFRLKGVMIGRTYVEVKQKGRLLERLEIQVVNLLEFTVTFNYISDNAGHRTTRNISDLDDAVSLANLTFQNNAAIKIIKHNVRQIQYDRDLKKVILWQNVWDIIASRRDKTAIFNTFWVWEYEQDETPNVDHADGAAINRVCMIEDNHEGYSVSDVLTHELGHLMTLPHHSKKDYFMNDLGTSQTFFRKNQVLAMRRGLQHIIKLAK